MLVDMLSVNSIPVEIIGTQNDQAQVEAFNYQKKVGMSITIAIGLEQSLRVHGTV